MNVDEITATLTPAQKAAETRRRRRQETTAAPQAVATAPAITSPQEAPRPPAPQALPPPAAAPAPPRSTMPDVELTDGFFTSLDNTQPFFKAAFEGFAGAGKTFTMVEIAIGLHRRIGSKRPIAYFDTEKAGRHLRKRFADAGVKVLYKQSRTLADLTEVMRRGREGAFDILLVDSITHIWETFLRSYQEKTGHKRLQFEDWGILKPKWKTEFSDPFVRDRYHSLMCGRAGYEYDEERVQDPITGKMRREIWKTGVKMKVEGETAYEPDMLIMMERFEEVLEKDKRVWREATIIKDRSTLLDGKTFKNPTFADFLPSIDYLLDEPVNRDEPAELENNFEGDEERREWARRRDIALETIENDMVKAGLAGQAAEAKKGKVAALEAAFGTASWTAIKSMHPDKLEDGVLAIRKYLRTVNAKSADGNGAATPPPKSGPRLQAVTAPADVE